jgi:hypothetical protein
VQSLNDFTNFQKIYLSNESQQTGVAIAEMDDPIWLIAGSDIPSPHDSLLTVGGRSVSLMIPLLSPEAPR